MKIEDGTSISIARLSDVFVSYGTKTALDGVTADIPAGCMVGVIGPDGVGKSTMLSLIAGAKAVRNGTVEVLGGDISEAAHRNKICTRIAFMPQGLGRNMSQTLSVEENLQFFGRLFGHDAGERRRRIDDLCRSTGLFDFLARPAGKLSGGMKQKLGLCCALIHDPDFLILDEPTTGVDPFSRSQFWELIKRIRSNRPGMSVVAATAYMEEARRFDWLIAMDSGRILAAGAPDDLLKCTFTDTLDAAFIALLPEEKRRGHRQVVMPPFADGRSAETAIEASCLTMRFGSFTAVDNVNLNIRRGEIFGFIGSNGCGKTTTMKMLTGLLEPTEGQAFLFGHKVRANDMETRCRVGYMSQLFSLYTELSVAQNLELHARLFKVPESEISEHVSEVAMHFDLAEVLDSMPDSLPLGVRQRLSLAVAMVHSPELLILDEPTSGVDPVARDNMWQIMIDLARSHHVTIFVSTHFMNEAERCDRISLMHAGKILLTGVPSDLVMDSGAAGLEETFINCLKAADHADLAASPAVGDFNGIAAAKSTMGQGYVSLFNWRHAWSYSIRESLEIMRDPVRAAMAFLGTIILMFVTAYGVSMDVEDLTYAVLDRDRTALSRNYAVNLSGSKYFIEHAPIESYGELERRMSTGEISLAIEFPPGFSRSIKRGGSVQIGAWVDGAMPMRAETVRGYVQGMHQSWLQEMAVEMPELGMPANPAVIETRFRYNPDVKSLPAMVPAVIPILLLMIPAMLTALSVVREKELGSIVNLYVTPVSRTEFMLGKQLPYIVIAMINFAFMSILAIVFFKVPLKGSLPAMIIGTLLFVVFSTGAGLFVSAFTKKQVAAMFMAVIITMIPATEFAGMINPVSSLEGTALIIGRTYPAAYYLNICRGVFNKALDFSSLWTSLWPILLAVPVIMSISVLLLKKQEA